MDERLKRFKLCDLRFYPYLTMVFDRLPQEIRENVLNDRSFQILTDEDLLNTCVLRYKFGDPVKTLVYFNTKILMEPEHQLIHTIAHEIAHHVLIIRESQVDEKKIEDLLIHWGFQKEVDAVRYDLAMAESKGYKIGYEWAKSQNQDYLMQHFGLYFDEWNEKGLGRVSDEKLELSNHPAETELILEDIINLKNREAVELAKDDISETLSPRKTMLAGIMTAVKEFKLNKRYSPKKCNTRQVPSNRTEL